MIGFIIRRLLSISVTFIIVSILIFTMMHAIPGGPFDGGEMPLPPEVRAKMMAQFGLDQPVWVQYLKYMSGVIRLDFGVPFQSPGETMFSLLADAWVPSLVLGGLGVLIGAPWGFCWGSRRRCTAIHGSTTLPRAWRRWA